VLRRPRSSSWFGPGATGRHDLGITFSRCVKSGNTFDSRCPGGSFPQTRRPPRRRRIRVHRATGSSLRRREGADVVRVWIGRAVVASCAIVLACACTNASRPSLEPTSVPSATSQGPAIAAPSGTTVLPRSTTATPSPYSSGCAGGGIVLRIDSFSASLTGPGRWDIEESGNYQSVVTQPAVLMITSPVSTSGGTMSVLLMAIPSPIVRDSTGALHGHVQLTSTTRPTLEPGLQVSAKWQDPKLNTGCPAPAVQA
jgi:hypothetical protein